MEEENLEEVKLPDNIASLIIKELLDGKNIPLISASEIEHDYSEEELKEKITLLLNEEENVEIRTKLINFYKEIISKIEIDLKKQVPNSEGYLKRKAELAEFYYELANLEFKIAKQRIDDESGNLNDKFKKFKPYITAIKRAICYGSPDAACQVLDNFPEKDKSLSANMARIVFEATWDEKNYGGKWKPFSEENPDTEEAYRILLIDRGMRPAYSSQKKINNFIDYHEAIVNMAYSNVPLEMILNDPYIQSPQRRETIIDYWIQSNLENLTITDTRLVKLSEYYQKRIDESLWSLDIQKANFYYEKISQTLKWMEISSYEMKQWSEKYLRIFDDYSGKLLYESKKFSEVPPNSCFRLLALEQLYLKKYGELINTFDEVLSCLGLAAMSDADKLKPRSEYIFFGLVEYFIEIIEISKKSDNLEEYQKKLMTSEQLGQIENKYIFQPAVFKIFALLRECLKPDKPDNDKLMQEFLKFHRMPSEEFLDQHQKGDYDEGFLEVIAAYLNNKPKEKVDSFLAVLNLPQDTFNYEYGDTTTDMKIEKSKDPGYPQAFFASKKRRKEKEKEMEQPSNRSFQSEL